MKKRPSFFVKIKPFWFNVKFESIFGSKKKSNILYCLFHWWWWYHMILQIDCWQLLYSKFILIWFTSRQMRASNMISELKKVFCLFLVLVYHDRGNYEVHTDSGTFTACLLMAWLSKLKTRGGNKWSIFCNHFGYKIKRLQKPINKQHWLWGSRGNKQKSMCVMLKHK